VAGAALFLQGLGLCARRHLRPHRADPGRRVSVRFRDRDHRRLVAIAAAGAPDFTEADLFRIPADVGFDPTKPFRLQLLVQREVGPIEKVFTTFDLGYQLPEIPARRRAPRPPPPAASRSPTQDEAPRRQALWKRIWRDKTRDRRLARCWRC
jgi:NosR/NirI family nitrous oxide reductase transcriptional regulator